MQDPQHNVKRRLRTRGEERGKRGSGVCLGIRGGKGGGGCGEEFLLGLPVTGMRGGGGSNLGMEDRYLSVPKMPCVHYGGMRSTGGRADVGRGKVELMGGRQR